MFKRAAGAVVCASVLLVSGCASNSDGLPEAAGAPPTSITDAPRPTYPTPAKIVLPTNGHLLVFGDSWTYGLKADPVTSGFAYLTAEELGLDPEVQGVGGTGYLNPGPHHEGTFAQRLAKLPASLPAPALIIIQGGTNDVGHSTAAEAAAAKLVYSRFQARFPGVPIVVVGTGTSDPRLNVFGPIDEGTREAAGELGLNYISPLAEHWFTMANAAQVIKDPTDSPHPSTYGHRLFADHLVQDLNSISR